MTGSRSSDDGDFGEWKVAALRKVMSGSTGEEHRVKLAEEEEGWDEDSVGYGPFKARRRGWGAPIGLVRRQTNNGTFVQDGRRNVWENAGES